MSLELLATTNNLSPKANRLNDTNSDGTSLELEELEPSKLIGPQQDVETVESWADRNGLTYGTARAWAMKGVLPTVKPGKRRMVNSALLRS